MSAPLLTTSATIMCPHGGQGTIVPSQTAAMAGATICTQSDMVLIAGCPFTIGPNPSPCLTVQWLTASTICTAGGKPLLTTNSVGLCMSPASAPQGPVVLVPGQTIALGA
jgi:hypothetical protein